ncbi:MAG: hypothetical protein NZ935_13855, partial [Planctomycetes bacterium]|nr:hypothetical protein [Planctomycetota bacterium]
MRAYISFLSVLVFVMICGELRSQQDGQIFRMTPETRAMWEFNSFNTPPGIPLEEGTVVPDLSGNGNDAIVKNNGAGDMQPGLGTQLCEGDSSVSRIGPRGNAHVATNGDGSAFEFGENESFSLELYVIREE